MTRCLFWNVERFNEDRFYSASAAADPVAGMTKAQSATDRQALLNRVIEAADPDIVVIVETVAQSHPSTALAQQITAPLQVLDWLRAGAHAIASLQWRLVPPLVLSGQRRDPNTRQIVERNVGQETIAVFYRGLTGTTHRYFTGPNTWPGGVNGRSVLPGPNATRAAPYGTNTRGNQNVDLNALLVPPTTAARTIPANAAHNATLAENTLAARTQLRVMTNTGGAGANADFGEARPPLMVTFTEQDNQGALRDLTLFCVHAPANEPGATAFIRNLAGTYEVGDTLGANETRMIGGDFNANLLRTDGAPNPVFNPLTNHPRAYKQLLRPTGQAPTTPAALEAWLGYFGTCIKVLDKIPINTNWQTLRFLWSDGTTLSYYPPYNYFDAGFPSIDNVLVSPYDSSRNYQTTIMNTVVSSPMAAVTVPEGASAGTVQLAAGISPVASAAWPQAPAAADYDQATASQLKDWQHYGHICSTSDHFALFVDV